jgi:DNA mismatch repair protein MutL
MTLAYPGIKIRLINNGNILFSTNGKGDIHSNILTIYSKEIGDKLIHLTEENGDISLEAFVSAPNNSKTNRKSQIFFVNGRYISSKIMENAVSDAYLEKLFEGRYPITFLFLRIAPEKLDVNIHPNKKEVRFDDERMVRDSIAQAIRNGLKTKEAIPEIKEKNLFREISGTIKPKNEEQVDIKRLLSEQRKSEDIKSDSPDIKEVIKEPVKELIKETQASYIPEKHGISDISAETEQPRAEFDMRLLTVTGSVFGTYITAVDENNLYMIDQHAAHERIFYEQLLSQYQNEEKAQQLILAPVVINVTHAVKNDTGEMLDFLGNLGFEIEEFGPTAYIMKAIPVFMELEEARDFIDYLLDNISEEADLDNQRKIQSIITNACKKAVKAHDVLDKKEIDRLIADLAKTKNPYSCPHGRPTFVRLKQYEIEKMFKRV